VSGVVLSIRQLAVSVRTPHGMGDVVNGISFDLHEGEILGLVGESGCGKTKTAEAIMRILPAGSATMRARAIDLDGTDLLALTESQMRRIRGREISMVFQEPLTALDPVFTVGWQLSAVLRRHRRLRGEAGRTAACDILTRVGFGDVETLMRRYPHELSGGMRQRIVMAMALACHPRVLIADEPTSSLDVTTQAGVLARLTELGREAGTGILLITHDLGIVAQYCDRALIMREGHIVEDAPVGELFRAPRHDYTAELLRCVTQGRP
jgi:peptide/nickel transport system ATP-binding protein